MPSVSCSGSRSRLTGFFKYIAHTFAASPTVARSANMWYNIIEFTEQGGKVMLEIRLLKYFLAVAREQGISGAAEPLYISQPTLSRQLMDLERSDVFKSVTDVS